MHNVTAIERIKDIEGWAAALLRGAQEKAQQIVKTAGEEARSLREKVMDRARLEAEKECEQILENSSARTREIFQQAEAEIAAKQQSAKQHFQEAVKMLINEALQ